MTTIKINFDPSANPSKLKKWGETMKKSNEKDWIELGAKVKEIDKEISELIIQASKIMAKKDIKNLQSASRSINRFRSNAEDIMFSKKFGDVNTFYGDSDA